MEVSTLHLPVALTQALPIGKKLATPGNGIVKMGLNDFSHKKRTSSSSSRRALKTCSAVVSNRAPPAINKVADDEDLEKIPPWELVTKSGELVTPTKHGLPDEELKEYMSNILSLRVYEVAKQSELEHATSLYDKYGINVYLKREDRQQVFSFKLRGAYNMMSKLPKDVLQNGVICASAGNHAQGVALATSKLGGNALIYMPVTTPDLKRKAVEKIGGKAVTVKLFGDTYDEAQAEAKRVAEERGLKYIPPFDDSDVIAGQGTIAVELGRQMTRSVRAIFVPIGGGGLISGIAIFMKKVYPDIKIIGVEPWEANSMALAFKHDKRITVDPIGKFADGVAVATVGEETFKLSRELVDGVVIVSRAEISSAIQDMYEENRMIAEPSGALAIAGAVAYCKARGLEDIDVISIISGANMDFKQLSVITDYANIGNETECVFASYVVEQPGSFKKLVECIKPLDISECKYRYDPDQEEALVYYRVGYKDKSDLEAMEDRLRSGAIHSHDLTHNELVTDHLKHLVGSRASIENEVLYRFLWPEKAGSLLDFLDVFTPRWNVTMFNYRGRGELVAHALVGFQVNANELDDFEDIAKQNGYEFKRETNNNAFQLLMQ